MALPKKEDVETVFRVLKDHDTQHNVEVNWKSIRNPLKWSWKIKAVAIPFLLSFFSGLSSTVFPTSDWPLLLTLLFLLLTYIAIAVVQILMVAEEREAITGISRNPLSQTLALVKEHCVEGIEIASKLQNMDKLAISFVYEQLSRERLATTTRSGLIVGAVDKVGLIPGLLTLYVSGQKLFSGSPSFLTQYIIPIAVAFLYIVFTLYFYPSLLRLDKYLTFLELVKDKTSQENN